MRPSSLTVQENSLSTFVNDFEVEHDAAEGSS